MNIRTWMMAAAPAMVICAPVAQGQPVQTVFGPLAEQASKIHSEALPPNLRRYLQASIGSADADLRPTTLVRWAKVPLTKGRYEIIVYMSGGGAAEFGEMGGWCGSAGCNVTVLIPVGRTYKLIGDFQAWAPIRRLETAHGGYPDLGVWVQGGGVFPGYEARIPFNEGQYPAQGGVASGHRVVKGTRGPIIIDARKSARPLFP